MRKTLKSAIPFIIALIIALIIAFAVVPSLISRAFAAGDFNISTMRPEVDNNSFSNSAEDFIGEKEKSKYYLTAVELNKLTEGESEDTKNLITSQALSKFNGACYGISATMALSYAGGLDIPESNYYSVNLRKHPAFRNMINYYHLTQYCEKKYPASTFAVLDGKISEDSLKQIVEYAKGGTPFIVNFRTEEFPHTLVCCGYEHGDDGTHRIRIIDCNKKDAFIYLTVSPSYNSWQFENSDYNSEDVIDLSFSTLEAFSAFDLKKTDENKSETVYSTVSSSVIIDTVCTNMRSSFTLTNDDGKTLTFNNGVITGDIEASKFKYIANSDGELNTKVIFTIEDSNSYTVQNNAEEIDLTVVGDNGLFFTAQGKNIKRIEAQEGKTSIEGENMEYSVNMLSTEENVDMVNVCGADPDKVSFETKDGMTLSEAENGKTHVSIVSYGQFYETDLEIEYGKLSVYYSDVVKTNHVSGKGSPVMKGIVLAFIAAVFTVTLVYTVRKYKNKKASSKKNGAENG